MRALLFCLLAACGGSTSSAAKPSTCQDLTFHYVDDPTTMNRGTYASPVKTADDHLCEKR